MTADLHAERVRYRDGLADSIAEMEQALAAMRAELREKDGWLAGWDACEHAYAAARLTEESWLPASLPESGPQGHPPRPGTPLGDHKAAESDRLSSPPQRAVRAVPEEFIPLVDKLAAAGDAGMLRGELLAAGISDPVFGQAVLAGLVTCQNTTAGIGYWLAKEAAE